MYVKRDTRMLWWVWHASRVISCVWYTSYVVLCCDLRHVGWNVWCTDSQLCCCAAAMTRISSRVRHVVWSSCDVKLYVYMMYIWYIFVLHIELATVCHMGWLRLVDSLKLQVSFAKEPYKRDNILRSLLIVATEYLQLCITLHCFTSHSTSHSHSCFTSHFWQERVWHGEQIYIHISCKHFLGVFVREGTMTHS